MERDPWISSLDCLRRLTKARLLLKTNLSPVCIWHTEHLTGKVLVVKERRSRIRMSCTLSILILLFFVFYMDFMKLLLNYGC